jgi:hypothetical protein
MTIDEMISRLELHSHIYRITYFVSTKQTIKVTRQHKPDKRSRQATYVVTVGKPNYAEREYIKRHNLAGVLGVTAQVLYKSYK